MADLAIALTGALARRNEAGTPGDISARRLGKGDGWVVDDMICTADRRDRAFEERHGGFSIALILAGSFQYSSGRSSELMTPGSIMLGSPGQCFVCAHDHAPGDRCLSFRFAPEFFRRSAHDAGAPVRRGFASLRVPPVRALSPLISRAIADLPTASDGLWEEIATRVSVAIARLTTGAPTRDDRNPLPSSIARVTRAVRDIERHDAARLPLASLARRAGLSPYHFLRTFESITGATPHQYVRRLRLRDAAVRLLTTNDKVLDVALASGFGDVSNFNRAFRAEFGASPRAYRAATLRDV
ncbi:MAG TPA: AraC family transcriptional regulator [Vicinamibacterales bacterium]|nr:AraC family transcriptional regulator [Vicinamibacterales bacterium]